MTRDPMPNTELGENILRLVRLYGHEMMSRMIFESVLQSGRTEITIGEKNALQESVRLIIVPIFEEVQNRLLADEDPAAVLSDFIKSRL